MGLVRSIVKIALVASVFLGGAALAQTNPATEADHAGLLEQLRIERLRPGVNGMDPKAANAVNYDEAKAGPFSLLPDPLTFSDGKPVTTADQWLKVRRPELIDLFAHEIHGYVPARTPEVKWTVVRETRAMRAGRPVIERRLSGIVDNSRARSIDVKIDMLLVTPEGAAKVPVVLELGFPDGPPWLRDRGPQPEPAWHALAIQRGWAYAVLDPYSVQADNGAGLTRGVIGLMNKGKPRDPADWGALRAWAWGASRALDFFDTDPATDAKRVAIEGMSRYGKAALVAMAYEPRLAVGFIASSGEGGAKLFRRKRGEQLENLAASGEYHWMAGNFVRYAGPLQVRDLPVDAHELIALVAPRPLFISSGNDKDDAWVDARGMFMATVAAGPVYRLLGARDLGTATFPAQGTLIADGDLAFRQHEGGHTAGPNWPYFLDFAARYLEPKP